MRLADVTLVSALLVPLAASAHDTKGVNGGRVSDAGAYHVELVLREASVDVFVSDANERPLGAAGFKATAVVVLEGKPHRIALEPQGNARLSGKAPAPLSPDVKAAVQLTAPDGKTAQARFN